VGEPSADIGRPLAVPPVIDTGVLVAAAQAGELANFALTRSAGRGQQMVRGSATASRPTAGDPTVKLGRFSLASPRHDYRFRPWQPTASRAVQPAAPVREMEDLSWA
jgi:hypothetical protein